MLEGIMKIHQVLQNFKYIILENYILKIEKIFLCLGTYFYANILFLQKKIHKNRKLFFFKAMLTASVLSAKHNNFCNKLSL